jgi:hypothetical protein
MPKKLSPKQPCATRRSISFRPNITIRWNCSLRLRSGKATAG